MKHILIFLTIGVSILILATRKSALDIVLLSTVNYSSEQVGNRFLEVEESRLPISPKDLVQPGVITIIYFHDIKCPGCLKMDRDMEDFVKIRPDVAIRKIAMSVDGDAYNKAIRDYRWKIYSAPCILIFGKNGKLIAADEKLNFAGSELLREWMEKEFERNLGK
ncbi:TlpA family protein disulfide reductase [Undibacterium sp. Dicai25W]|uniref:TlpA family protein disulfide reductase n=1 Tax=Undibacterium sp. Dicai25W TaxID=3413034 RepID=UPI003BF30422